MRSSARAQAPLDESAFIDEVKRRSAVGGTPSIAAAVVWVLDHRTLRDDLAADLLRRGAEDLAADRLNRDPRSEILRRVVVASSEPSEGLVHEVTVIRSELRDWPIGSAGGRILDECSVEEARAELHHIDRTVAGLLQRARPLRAAVMAAEARGLEQMRDLDDDTLDACLRGDD